ncbi:hypothetical protein LBMAG56_05460 [Verrucomicrobiota bacterium]|nr:hypothetical protein LBMAG56_05460 [Verrucomicrobiota bacterium]
MRAALAFPRPERGRNSLAHREIVICRGERSRTRTARPYRIVAGLRCRAAAECARPRAQRGGAGEDAGQSQPSVRADIAAAEDGRTPDAPRPTMHPSLRFLAFFAAIRPASPAL